MSNVKAKGKDVQVSKVVDVQNGQMQLWLLWLHSWFDLGPGQVPSVLPMGCKIL